MMTERGGCVDHSTISRWVQKYAAEMERRMRWRHRQVKYLNNVVEADHGKLKQLIRPVGGFKTMKTAYTTIRGFEVMRAFRKGQGRAYNLI